MEHTFINMKSLKVLILAILLVLPVSVMHAQLENLEIGIQAGGAIFWGQHSPTDGYTRNFKLGLWSEQWIQSLRGTEDKDKNIPGFEIYGALVRYRIDNHWDVTAKATRQRMLFREYEGDYSQTTNLPYKWYYNAAWHVDLTAEYNILNYGRSSLSGADGKTYTYTPYILFGIGTSIYNKNAVRRSKENPNSTYYPMVGGKHNGEKFDLAAALYIPVGVGFKWRVASNWQVQLTAQYNFYLLNGNIAGYTSNVTPENSKITIGANHDLLLSLGAVYNFGKWYKGGKSCRCEDYF